MIWALFLLMGNEAFMLENNCKNQCNDNKFFGRLLLILKKYFIIILMIV